MQDAKRFVGQTDARHKTRTSVRDHTYTNLLKNTNYKTKSW